MIDLLARIAEQKKATPAQIALAWLLAQKPWIVPIPGTTKLPRLEENLGADSVKLTADDLRDIDRAASKISVQGNRYPEKLEQMTGHKQPENSAAFRSRQEWDVIVTILSYSGFISHACGSARNGRLRSNLLIQFDFHHLLKGRGRVFCFRTEQLK